MNRFSIPFRRYCWAILLLSVLFLSNLPLLARSQESAPERQPTTVYLPLLASSGVGAPAFANCRYGSVSLWNAIDRYDVASLNLGWYLTYPRAEPARPNGAMPVNIVHLRGRDCRYPECPDPEYWPEATISPAPTDSELGRLVDQNPGAIWVVGNEPDRRYYMDDVLPDQYARAYHAVHTFIKARDPSARVGMGGVVVPTPLRLQYLEMILDAYQDTYGLAMPVDVWSTHVHIVREVRDSWGADIPPGIDVERGTVFTKSQHADLATFQQLVIDFRTWMKANGEQDKPLLITEFGILWPEWLNDEFGNPFDSDRVIDFMHQTMHWLDGYQDRDLGFPADNYRLVQRWNWYSLDDDSVHDPDDPESYRWNGWLFESDTQGRSLFGDAFAAYTRGIQPAPDLMAYRLETWPSPPPLAAPGESVTLTLQAVISNPGNSSIARPFEVAFYEKTASDLRLIGTVLVETPVPGCGETFIVQLPWPMVEPGAHQVQVVVDPGNSVPETDENNNTLLRTIMVGSQRVYLPFAVGGLQR